jgi:hypothetical protein
MLFDGGFRFSGSSVASTVSPPASPRSLAVTSRSGSGGALGHVRSRLLGGAARIALPAASVIVALGVGLPSEASAQSSGFNGTQATTYTLTTGANTATFTFGPNTVIGPTVLGTAGVTGDTITSWNIINQGQINGGGGGGAGIFLDTAGGNSVTNSGTITEGVSLGAGSTLTNLAAGTITGSGAYSITATEIPRGAGAGEDAAGDGGNAVDYPAVGHGPGGIGQATVQRTAVGCDSRVGHEARNRAGSIVVEGAGTGDGSDPGLVEIFD